MKSDLGKRFASPETRRLALQPELEMIHAARKGHNEPETLDEADRALQYVPNWSGLNHCDHSVKPSFSLNSDFL